MNPSFIPQFKQNCSLSMRSETKKFCQEKVDRDIEPPLLHKEKLYKKKNDNFIKLILSNMCVYSSLS